MAIPKWMRDECIIGIGLNLADRDRFDEAITYFDGAIEGDPENARLYFFRGRIKREAGLASRERISSIYDAYPVYKNTPQSKQYFRASLEDYEKAMELYGSQDDAETTGGRKNGNT